MTNSESCSGQSDRQNESGRKVLILFGEILADVFPDRLVLGGAPFNVARHLAAFGLHPVLISRLGNDPLGVQILRDMQTWDMDSSGIQVDPNLPTGHVRVCIGSDGHHFEILPNQAYDFIDSASAVRTLKSISPRFVYFGTLAQRHDVSRHALGDIFRNTASLRFLDINLRDPWYDKDIVQSSLQHSNIVKLNREELGVLAAMFDVRAIIPEDQAVLLADLYGIDSLIVTCGREGAWQYDRHSNALHVARPDKELTDIVDTVGAGDAFAAITIAGRILDWPVDLLLQRANTFAAAICGIRGAVPQHHDFYLDFSRDWNL